MSALYRKLVLLGIVLVVGLTAGVVVWKRLHTVTLEGDPVRYYRRAGERAYRAFPTIAATDAQGIKQLFDDTPAQDPKHQLSDDPARVDALRTTVAEFLSARFSAEQPSEYYDWMIAHGYHFMSKQEYEDVYGSWRGYQKKVGVTKDDARAIAYQLWNFKPQAAARVEAVCTGSDAALIQIGYATKYRDVYGEIAYGSLGFDLWHGASSTRCTMWLSPPMRPKQLALQADRVTIALVSIIVRTATNRHHPMKIYLYLDPDTAHWWIYDITVSNDVGTSTARACMEF